MSENIDVSIIVPAFNEEQNLGPLVEEIEAAMNGLPYIYEVIVINDGSTDRTLEVLDEMKKRHSAVRVVNHAMNCGQSAGQATGFRVARGGKIVTMDADLQNDPADIPNLLSALKGGIDCVCGVRRVRRDNLVRRASSRIANGFRNAITGDKVTDAGCTFRSIRKDALAEVPVFNGMHRFLPSILRAQGYKVEEISVNHRSRTRGYSKYGINDRLWRGIRDCFAMRWYSARVIRGNRILDD
jgi:dolichol-phosphate mannosyltransferase